MFEEPLTVRERLDAEVAAACTDDAERDLGVYRDWESTIADGLD